MDSRSNSMQSQNADTKDLELALARMHRRSDFLARSGLFLASETDCERALERVGELAALALGASFEVSYAPEEEKRRTSLSWPDPGRSAGFAGRWLSAGAEPPPADAHS